VMQRVAKLKTKLGAKRLLGVLFWAFLSENLLNDLKMFDLLSFRRYIPCGFLVDFAHAESAKHCYLIGEA
jgi:hypothetical protein